MSGPTRKALITLGSQQYADQLAAALAEGDMLARYYCGTRPRPDLRATIGRRFRLAPSLRIRLVAVRKLLGRSRHYRPIIYRLYRDFDRRLAHLVRARDVDAVIAYENGAVHMFEAAKALGKLAILDAADCHYRFQQAMGDSLGDPELQVRVNAGKDREIELADYILCCSQMAKESYAAAGFPAEKIFVAGLGADLSRFGGAVPRPARSGPLKLLFAGRFTVKKGADVLIEALERLRAEGSAFSLEVAADVSSADPALVRRFEAVATIRGKVPQHELPAIMAAADLILVPSRFDSYGMVVAEAMACGTPALVTDNVGAKDLIERGVNGFMVPPGDADALHAQLAWCAAHPEEVRAMSEAAARAGATADWSRYREQVRSNVRTIFARHWPA